MFTDRLFGLEERFSKKLEYERFCHFLPYRAWDPETGIYILDHGKQSRPGWFFVCFPIYPKKEFKDELETLISSLPANSTLQISILAAPYVKSVYSDFLRIRNKARLSKNSGYDKNASRVLRHVLTEKIKLFIKMTKESNSTSYPYLLKNLTVYFSFTVPSSEGQKVVELKTKTKAILSSAGFSPTTGTPLDLYDLISFFFKKPPGIVSPSNLITFKKWLSGEKKEPDPDQFFVPLSELITPPDLAMKVKSDRIITDHHVVTSISYKHYPGQNSFDVMNRFLGDPERPEIQLAMNFFHTLNIFIPDQSKAKEKISRKHTVSAWQAFGPIAKFVPKMGKMKEELAQLVEKSEEQSLCEAYLHSMLIISDPAKTDEVTSTYMGYVKKLNFYPVRDRFILLPLFFNSLPMGLFPDEMSKLFRKRTFTSEICASLSPAFGEGCHFGKPVLLFGTRRGFLYSGDIFASPTAYNGLIFGATGQGKSFFLNEIITSYFSAGGKVIVVDIGGSFKKICSLFKGEYVEFSEKSPINLNPLAHLSLDNPDELTDEMEMLKDFTEMICAPKKGFTDFQKAALSEIFYKVIEKYRDETNYDLLAEELKKHSDQRIKDIATMLMPWIGNGENARWLKKGRPIEFDNDLMVIEIEELSARPALRAIALYYLIYRISYDFLQRSTKDMEFKRKPKFLFIDEAWELLRAGNVDFIERGYRRFRKTGSGIFIISQGPTDLEGTPITDAVWANSQYVISLKVEAFNQKKVEGRLSKFAINILPKLRTIKGLFSELYIKSPFGEEILRFYAPRFTQLAYSTNAKEVAKIESLRQKGLSYVQAIQQIMKEEIEEFKQKEKKGDKS